MTLTEALEAMAEGHKVKHVSYFDDEYIYNDRERKQFFTEDGHEIGDIIRNEYKNTPYFEKGWEIFAEE